MAEWGRYQDAFKAIYEALGGTDTSIEWGNYSKAFEAIYNAAKIRRSTLFGGVKSPKDVWSYLGYRDPTGVFGISIRVKVASGKTFKLWALGQGLCDSPVNSNIRVIKDETQEVIKELGLGVAYDEYSTPIEVDGPCSIDLQGFNNLGLFIVSGFMMFSIE
jgi:hypothetical protein